MLGAPKAIFKRIFSLSVKLRGCGRVAVLVAVKASGARMSAGRSAPVQCLLCAASDGIVPAGFQQLYRQPDLPPVAVDWWACPACQGWFADPVPPPAAIERYWGTVDWADPNLENKIRANKDVLIHKIFTGLERWTERGPLLDVGCNFGQFMLAAREAGWPPVGFDPSTAAAEKARAKGFDVRCEWALENAGFAEESFAAITSIDVFYYAWHPYATLALCHRLLRPGGVLVMRISNKRFVLGLVRAVLSAGAERDARISRILQGQFHTISMRPLSRILRQIGFDRVSIQPRAATAPWAASGWGTRGAYICTDLLHLLSFGTINLSPGVLVFARKGMGARQ
jgi:SAM-dependent methyltransferase